MNDREPSRVLYFVLMVVLFYLAACLADKFW
jgi:hypothetical protein